MVQPGRQADHACIAAGLHHRVPDAMPLQYCNRSVHRVAFAEASGIDRHSRGILDELVALQLYLTVVDLGEHALKFSLCW